MKTAVITGGSGTIGKALVEEFAKDYHVIFTYHTNKAAADEIADKYNAKSYCMDQSVADDIISFGNTLSSCDLLINNAGISDTRLFTDVPYNDLKMITDVDLTGAMLLTKAVLPIMIKQKKGCIINISSIWGIYGASCEVAYSAAKAGMIGFTKALSKEVGLSGVRVNCIAPGMIDSKMNSHLSNEEINDFLNSTSLCKIGSPKDVAQAARYLSEAEFVTGQVLGVDGGF